MLPLTLAVLDGMLVAVGKEKYILPLTNIIETIRPERHHVRAMAGGGQVVSIRGEFIRLIYLCRVFDAPGAVAEPWNGLVVLVETESGAKLGVVVDELIGQQQVVIKSLQENFDQVAGISGATILGNGKVSLILDVEQLSRMPQSRPASEDAARGDDGSSRGGAQEPSRNDAGAPPSADNRMNQPIGSLALAASS